MRNGAETRMPTAHSEQSGSGWLPRVDVSVWQSGKIGILALA